MPIKIKASTVNSDEFIARLDLPEPYFDAAKATVFTFGIETAKLVYLNGDACTIACTLSQAKKLVDGTLDKLTRLAVRERVMIALGGLTNGALNTTEKLGSAVAAVSKAAGAALAGMAKPETLYGSFPAAGAASGPSFYKNPATTLIPKVGLFGLDHSDETHFATIFGTLPPLPPKKAVPIPHLDSGMVEAKLFAGPCTPHEMRHAKPVQLLHATRLYQPVTASSVGSRYFAVALRLDLKIAARLLQDNLSIRVEGELEHYSAQLSLAGFEPGVTSSSVPYRSVHFHSVTGIMAAKTLGAVLMALSLTWATPMPQLDVIQGEGA